MSFLVFLCYFLVSAFILNIIQITGMYLFSLYKIKTKKLELPKTNPFDGVEMIKVESTEDFENLKFLLYFQDCLYNLQK